MVFISTFPVLSHLFIHLCIGRGWRGVAFLHNFLCVELVLFSCFMFEREICYKSEYFTVLAT